MLVLWVLAAITLTVSGAPTLEDTRINGENGWYVPQQDGSFVWWTIEEAEVKLKELEAIESRALSLDPVTFYLYTNSNSKKQQIKATEASIKASDFNPKYPTRFVIHGWTQSYTSSMNSDIRDAWLGIGDFNIIAVDWSRARSDYATAALAVPTAGKKVATMIEFLNENHGMSLATLTVIGHSLGAHIAGYAGKNIKSGQIHTIVGLDPALPLFSYTNSAKRLAITDAYYVESIQTNGGDRGFLQPIGKGAFYPNGGKTQPGCILDVTGSCAHARSIAYYTEAVKDNDFPTMKCENYVDAVANSCGGTYSSVRMGANTNAVMVDGEYYVPVNRKAPFGMASSACILF